MSFFGVFIGNNILMKKTIRLTENDLIKLVKRVIKEQMSNVCYEAEKYLRQYHRFGEFYGMEVDGAGSASFTKSGKNEGYSPGVSMFVHIFGTNKNKSGIQIKLGPYQNEKEIPYAEIEKLFNNIFGGLGKRNSQGYIDFPCDQVKRFLELFKQFEKILNQKYQLKLNP